MSPNNKIARVYDLILARLPSTYPHAKLVIHSSLKNLCKIYWKGENKKNSSDKGDPFCFCDGITNTIHVPQCLRKSTFEEVSWYMLHEIGHLYALAKYGFSDYRWDGAQIAEDYANCFADRWVRKMKEEKFFESLNEEDVK